jgi:hypothetical protein
MKQSKRRGGVKHTLYVLRARKDLTPIMTRTKNNMKKKNEKKMKYVHEVRSLLNLPTPNIISIHVM